MELVYVIVMLHISTCARAYLIFLNKKDTEMVSR